LIYAAIGGYIKIVKFLLENGADINSKSIGGDTALTLAKNIGYKDIVDLLITKDAKG